MVAKVVHWHLCNTFHVHLDVTSWHDHQPLPVVENDEIKLLWDFGMVTDHMVCHNRPDITVFLKKDQSHSAFVLYRLENAMLFCS